MDQSFMNRKRIDNLEKVVVKIKKEYPDSILPSQAHQGDAGFDLYCHLGGKHQTLEIEPNKIVLVNTGVRIALPEGWEAQIRPRSGLACKHGITVATYAIQHGERIAQMVIKRVPKVFFIETDNLDETERGDGGFGSTGS
jgi:dUTP pyrophosphatase